jgi:SPP1 family phage portal protein
MELTLQQITAAQLEALAPLTEPQIIEKLIDIHEGSRAYKEMWDGVNYFGADHDILDYDFTEWTDYASGQVHYQTDKANNRIAHPFHRRQVLEKISYLLKNPITITHDNETLRDEYVDILGKKFHDRVIDWGTNASNKGREYLHIFFDGSKFDFMVMDAREIIPIYETTRQEKLESVIRYYDIVVNISDREETRTRVEWWFADKVEVYEEDANKVFKLELMKPHFTIGNTASEERVAGSWGRVPFIELSNNMGKISDLRFIKTLIDAYDMQDSILANDLEDIQEAIIKAIGLSDTPSEIRRNYKMFKVISTGANAEDVDIDYMSLDIPYEAKMAWMKNAEENINVFGQSIDAKTDVFGQNPSGVALNWLYLPLDLKAGLLQRKLEFALYELMWFVTTYKEILGQKRVENVEEFKFTFNKNMIANHKEQIELSNQSGVKLSQRTLLEQDPRVDDVDDEFARLLEQGNTGDDELGKLPLAIQQLALAKQRAVDTGQTEEANAIAQKIRDLISRIN